MNGECGAFDVQCVGSAGVCTGTSCGSDAACTAVHDSFVASAVSATTGGTVWGAGAATFYVWNKGSSECTSSNEDNAYAWFVDQGVTTVVRTFGCSTNDVGKVDDSYAQLPPPKSILTSDASGNDTNGCGVKCEACPDTLNSLCVGNSTAGGGSLQSTSVWENPDPTSSDREEPDLTALGEKVLMAGLGSTIDWEDSYEGFGNTGTSFAAPAVAALAALIQEGCKYWNVQGDSVALRALLQTSTYTRNPDGSRYSTQFWLPMSLMPPDQKDGSGAIDAASAMAFCEDGGDVNTAHFGGSVDLTQGGAPPGSETGPDVGYAPEDYAAPAANDGWLYSKVAGYQGVAKGDRIRASIAWNACSSSGAVAVDWDLLLWNAKSHIWVYSSQSFNNSTEGFDVEAPEAADYELWTRHPSGALACDGSTSDYLIGATVWGSL
jgi:hypothetical protein